MKNLNQSKNTRVNKVFNSVFDKYDLMNDLMSLGIHRLWKKKLIDWINPSINNNFLDMSSGTGDLAREFMQRVNFEGEVTCVEPNINMISAGKKRLKGFKNIKWVCSPAEKIPLENETFDFYAVSFGIRNFQDINKSLNEALRVLKPGGRFICLEFSKVENELLEKVYRIYSKTIPYLGKYLVGDSAPYDYLVKSIEDFYSQDELSGILRKNGFSEVEYRNLSGGIVAIHSGWKI
tara:strand:+ start:656 stop:1360 length:705 start_codon:yes stop_codon:yes gene_type:complete